MDLLAFRQQFVQRQPADDIPQRGLGVLGDGKGEILDLDHGLLGILDQEEQHAVDAAGTLSLVITCWLGMFSVSSRRSTNRTLSMNGTMYKMPGPFTSGTAQPQDDTAFPLRGDA